MRLLLHAMPLQVTSLSTLTAEELSTLGTPHLAFFLGELDTYTDRPRIKVLLEAYLLAPANTNLVSPTVPALTRFLCKKISENSQDALAFFCAEKLQASIYAHLDTCLKSKDPMVSPAAEDLVDHRVALKEILQNIDTYIPKHRNWITLEAISYLEIKLEGEGLARVSQVLDLLDTTFAFRSLKEAPTVVKKVFSSLFGEGKQRKPIAIEPSFCESLWDKLGKNINKPIPPPILKLLFVLEAGITLEKHWKIFAAAYQQLPQEGKDLLWSKLFSQEQRSLRLALAAQSSGPGRSAAMASPSAKET